MKMGYKSASMDPELLDGFNLELKWELELELESVLRWRDLGDLRAFMMADMSELGRELDELQGRIRSI